MTFSKNVANMIIKQYRGTKQSNSLEIFVIKDNWRVAFFSSRKESIFTINLFSSVVLYFTRQLSTFRDIQKIRNQHLYIFNDSHRNRLRSFSQSTILFVSVKRGPFDPTLKNRYWVTRTRARVTYRTYLQPNLRRDKTMCNNIIVWIAQQQQQ